MGGASMKKFNLDEYLKNPTKRVVTRDGRPVKIICTNFKNLPGNYSIVAEIEGSGCSESFTQSGEYLIGNSSQNDLFFAQEKREGWIPIFRSKYGPYPGKIFNSKEDAEESRRIYCCFTDDLYLATVKVEWEEDL